MKFFLLLSSVLVLGLNSLALEVLPETSENTPYSVNFSDLELQSGPGVDRMKMTFQSGKYIVVPHKSSPSFHTIEKVPYCTVYLEHSGFTPAKFSFNGNVAKLKNEIFTFGQTYADQHGRLDINLVMTTASLTVLEMKSTDSTLKARLDCIKYDDDPWTKHQLSQIFGNRIDLSSAPVSCSSSIALGPSSVGAGWGECTTGTYASLNGWWA